jgi:coniferyl-aldehyde dehydrogenase
MDAQATHPQLQAIFDLQYRASRNAIDVSFAMRRDRLLRMRNLLGKHAGELAKAINADFGVRSRHLTEVADIFVLHTMLGHTLRHLRGWMKPQRVRTPIYLQPASAHIQRQPLGVVGVIAPWNYPVQLSLGPAITALAAGNRVMLKPSELTPQTSQLLADLVGRYFTVDEFTVVQGEGEVAEAFSRLPFDHLFFTGSTAVGRKVAQAAAANLTPTTLELGGKSPCIVDKSCSLDDAAIKIAHGKLLNAGQTCIAPDYVLLPRGMEEAFGVAYAAAVRKLFPRIRGNPDYAAIVTGRHHARLQVLLAEAQGLGARLQVIDPPGTASPTDETVGAAGTSRQLPPALVFDVPAGAKLLEEEIFGPILPVIAYDSIQGAIEHINARPRPLALYWFGQDSDSRDRVLRQTVSGGVTVNDTLMHIAHENLPFGGVGESGWGSYHGEQGFLRFTQQKPVLVQSRFAMGNLFYPPYGKRLEQVLALIKRVTG